ncbi:twin-arginine translocation signal domain-containing protein [Rhodococcus sp. HNM0563]|uniref:twin-arginine translocation signal domain-containing protein n=1 Tax=Rhodococcus sp. HNM0563 TaxID=2716339 RepID=UPI003216C19F
METHALWSRRRFLGGVAATGVALTSVAWSFTDVAAARASTPSPAVRDTINGILAFVVPGNDPYSQHQGVSTEAPGGVTQGAAETLERTFDLAVPIPLIDVLGIDVTGSAAIAALVNLFAVTAAPNAVAGPFASPFANLSYAAKARVFELLDTEPQFPGRPIEYAVNAIPTLAAFVAYSEVSTFDGARRELTGRPVGWELTAYQGVSDGWDEFQGYYGGVERVEE